MRKNAIYLQKELFSKLPYDEYEKYFGCNTFVCNINNPIMHLRQGQAYNHSTRLAYLRIRAMPIARHSEPTLRMDKQK